MLKGKIAIVTGSTSGIGLGIARALAADGADILLNGFGDAPEIDQLRDQMAAEFGVKVAYCGADMTKATDIERMIEVANRELGKIDIVVNNAGIQHVATVQDFPLERWDAVIAINLTAPFLITRAVLPQMLERDCGRSRFNCARMRPAICAPSVCRWMAAGWRSRPRRSIRPLREPNAIQLASDGDALWERLEAATRLARRKSRLQAAPTA